MRLFATIVFVLFALTNCFPQKDTKQETKTDTKECTQKILLDNKQCMEISGPKADWKKITLKEMKPELVIMIPPKAKVLFAGSDGYMTSITINMDTTREDFTLLIRQNATEEYETFSKIRPWLLKTSRTCFEFLHDCQSEVILRVKDNTVALKDPTSYNSFAEKKIADDVYSFYVDGIIIRDMAKNDMTLLTLEDNMDVIKVFRSLKRGER